MESLTVVVDGDRATGDYDWLPAFKDRRTGHFEGSLDGRTIEATYAFVQEGRPDTAAITIRLDPEQAVIEGGPAALGLAATIARVECRAIALVAPPLLIDERDELVDIFGASGA